MYLSIFGAVIQEIIATIIASALIIAVVFIWRNQIFKIFRRYIFKTFKVGVLDTEKEYDRDEVVSKIKSEGQKAVTIQAMGVRLTNLVSTREEEISPLDEMLRSNINPTLKTRILVLDPNSKYVKSRAEEIGEDKKKLKEGIEKTISQLVEIKKHNQDIDIRIKLYQEDPVWSLVIIDQILFLGFYVRRKRKVAPCYICQSEPMSPFASFSKYFDYMWNEKSENLSETEDSAGT